MIKAIITDAGGVFVSSTDGPMSAEIDRIIGHHGHDLLFHDKRLLQRYQKGTVNTEQFIRQSLKSLGIKVTAGQFAEIMTAFSQMYKKHSKIDRKVLEYLLSFRSRYRVVLFSNTIEPHAQHNRKRFCKKFHVSCLSCEIGNIKPYKSSFRYVLRRIGLAADECVFIDDMPENVRAARSVGLKAIRFVDYGQLKWDMARVLQKKD
jgi:HAD superfamily hydrolase (TIGR01509 family)